MNRKTIFGLILCVLAAKLSKGKGFYIAVAPNVIQPKSEYSVSVTLPENNETAVVEVSMSGPSINATQTLEFEANKTTVATFNIPSYLANGTYTLKVRGIKGVEFENSTDLIYENAANVTEEVSEVKTGVGLTDVTTKRFGPLNLNVKKEVYRVTIDLLIKINSTEPLKYAVFDVIANGKLVKHQYFDIGGEYTTDYITITPTSDMIPKANVFVYFIEDENLIWQDLTIFFANTTECENNSTEFHKILAKNGEDEEIETISKPPGQASGLLTLTDANYDPERSKYSESYRK
ncbi:uncharacterized protein [Musca autumnalis]|uniref:uncharacterized protein n=1 Tax=Musca autumnalis TaxID=221902 RepID=UPI003CEFE851